MKASRLETAFIETGLSLPENGKIAVFRAKSGSDYSILPKDRTVLITSNRLQFDQLQAQGFEVADAAAGPFVLSIIEITRSKSETLGLIAAAFKETTPGGFIVVDGAKTDGIESVLKRCKSQAPIDHLVAKSHGKLFCMTRPDQTPPVINDWYSALALAPNRDKFATAAGMFSPEQIDKGSAMLAAHFDARIKGLVADLGAGWGWLTDAALKSGNITSIDLFEAEKTALDAAKLNIPDPRAQFFWADICTLQDKGKYDVVICNPPFHQSRAAEPAIGIDFIRKAAQILKPNGNLWLVANRQLPYEAALDQNFSHWKTLEETNIFKAVLATKPLSISARQRRANGVKPR
jgi:16S rRNA (guanine1207-N2)-methyltransferase